MDEANSYDDDPRMQDMHKIVTNWREESQEEAEEEEEDDETLMYPGTLVSADLYYDHDAATRTGLDVVDAINADEKADVKKKKCNNADKQDVEEQRDSPPHSEASPAAAAANVEFEQKNTDKDDMETLEDYENIVQDDPEDLEGRLDADGGPPQEKQKQQVLQQQQQKQQEQQQHPPPPAALFIPPQELECVRIMEKRMKEIRQNSQAYKAHDINNARRHEANNGKFDADVDIDANDLYVLTSAAVINQYGEDGDDDDYQGDVDDQNTISELSFDQHLVTGAGCDGNGRPFDEQSLPSLPSLAYMMHQQSGNHNNNNVDMVPGQYLTNGLQHPHDEVEPHLQFNWNDDEEKGSSRNDYCKEYGDDKQKQLRRKRLIYLLAIGLFMVICSMVIIVLLNTVFATDRNSNGQSTDSNANSVNDNGGGGFFGQDTTGNNGGSIATPQPTMVSAIDGSTQPSSMPSLEDPTTLTNSPTMEPTSSPTLVPTPFPTMIPPTFNPLSSAPSIGPSNQPSEAVVVVTSAPSAAPTAKATSKPTDKPTPAPTGCKTFIETSRDCYSGNDPTIRISFQNCDPQSQDWVGIFSVDDYSGSGGVPEPRIWDFTCGTQSCNQITPEGDLTFASNDNFFRLGRSYVAVLAREGTGPPYTRISSSDTFEIATNC